MLNFVLSTFWNTMFLPSGDQLGSKWSTASELSEVICCGLYPWASTIQMRRGPAQEASTARNFPSGEKEGLNALPRNFSSLPEATSFFQMSPPSYWPNTSPGSNLPRGWLERTNNILGPSGVHFGWMSSPVPAVNCCGSP